MTCINPSTNEVVDDSECGPVPADFTIQERSCSQMEECVTPQWYASPWGMVS